MTKPIGNSDGFWVVSDVKAPLQQINAFVDAPYGTAWQVFS